MKRILSNHKTEVGYIIALVAIILLSKTVFASTEITTEEPVIIVNTEEEQEQEVIETPTLEESEVPFSEEVDPHSPPVNDNDAELNQEIDKIEEQENVESEAIVEEDNTDAVDMVVGSEASDSIDVSVIVESLKVTNSLLAVLVIGIGMLIGTLVNGKAFGWLR